MSMLYVGEFVTDQVDDEYRRRSEQERNEKNQRQRSVEDPRRSLEWEDAWNF